MSERIHIPGHIGAFFIDRDGPEYRKTGTIRALRMEAPFEVETPEGIHRGEAGDWLAQGSAGELWPIKAERFADTYERVKDHAE